MDIEGKLRFAAESLSNAEDILRKSADAHPFLGGPGRAFKRMAQAATRPMRIGILGEANSGKSSLANLIAGTSALPAHPVVNSKFPALLKYAAKPYVTAIYEGGQRITLPVWKDAAAVVASIQESAGNASLPANGTAAYGDVKLIEVGLPCDALRSIEVLDIPAGRRGSPGLPMDAAIWTTVATQAWRETERTQWTKLPEAIRTRSLLAVKFCDLAEGGEKSLKRLQARLETSAKPYFRGICFIADGSEDLAASIAVNKILFVQLQYLAQEFSAERMSKAMAIARRVMTNALGKLGPALESGDSAAVHHPVAEASRGLFDDDWVAALSRPLPPGGFEKPAILRTPPSEPATHAFANSRRTFAAQPAEKLLKGRSLLIAGGAAALVAGVAVFAILPSGQHAGEPKPVVNPLPAASGADERDAKAEAAKRQKDAAGAAAAVEARKKAEAAEEARRKGEAEAKALEALRRLEAEEARKKAQAEAAAQETRKKAEAAEESRRKAEAEAKAQEALKRLEAEAAAEEARRKAQAEAAAAEAEARGKAEAEAAAAAEEERRQAEAASAEERKKAAAEAHRKAEAAAKRKKEAEAQEAERRRKAEAQEAEKRARAAAENAAPRPAGGSSIMHGIGQ
jgi:hypothetical protein